MSTRNTKATLYMIPLPVADGALQTLSPEVSSVTATITHYFVENVRTARRFLRSVHAALVIENLTFSEIDKHHGPDIAVLSKWIKEGQTIGIMSEAGCPGIADPGAELVAVAQAAGATVIPLVGPSSLLLALMASGLNGQSFSFNGYLPVKEPARAQRIRELEARSVKENQTQIFIETPYRNNLALADLLKHCKLKTRICIARNITAPDASIITKTAGEWVGATPQLDKVPVVFLLLG